MEKFLYDILIMQIWLSQRKSRGPTSISSGNENDTYNSAIIRQFIFQSQH